jgi:hypothetical protein
MAYMGWVEEREILPCRACKITHERRGETAPCATCIPPLMPENEQPIKVYLMVRNQVITVGMGQVVDLHFPSVKMIMDLFAVADQRVCFEKVTFLFHEWLKDYQLKMKYKEAEARRHR